MPVMDNDRAIKEYWEEVKHEYPDISFEDFRKICRSPFDFIKKCISGGEFPRILVKYLGKFKVFEGRIRNLMTKNQQLYEKGFRSEVDYERIKIDLANHLNRIQNEKDDDEEDDDATEGPSEV